jgi:Domain of unknown function (DUF4407)
VGSGGIFIWLSGASRRILEACPTERPKYFGIGAVVFITGAMAAVSAAFALVNALKVLLIGAIIFAFFWGLAIMMIDRLFVATMRRPSSRLYALGQALPRILMAFVIGLVISTPFVLQLFKPEITNEVRQMQATQIDQYYRSLPSNKVNLEVQADQAEVNKLENQAAVGGAGIDINSDPELESLSSQLSQAQSKETYWAGQLNCQLYGSGKSGGVNCVPGYGPLGHDDQVNYSNAVQLVATLQKEVTQRTQHLENENANALQAQAKSAKAQLKSAEQALAFAQADLNQQKVQVTGGIKNNDGILEQLKALDAVTAGNPTLQWARILLFLIFLFIDIMPVFVKTMMNLSKEPSPYDRILAEEERMRIQAAEDSLATLLMTHRQTMRAEAASVRHWNETLRAEPDGSRERLRATVQRLDEARRERYERDRMRDLADGESFIGLGLRPEPPSGNGYGPWPPRGSTSSKGRPSAGRNGHQQAGPGAGQAARGTEEASATGASFGSPNGGQAGQASGGPGPGPWTGQHSGVQPPPPQGGEGGLWQSPEPTGENPLRARLRSFHWPRVPWRSFFGGRNREQPEPGEQEEAAQSADSSRYQPGQGWETADTQPQRPFPWANFGRPGDDETPGDGTGPAPTDPGPESGPVGVWGQESIVEEPRPRYGTETRQDRFDDGGEPIEAGN